MTGVDIRVMAMPCPSCFPGDRLGRVISELSAWCRSTFPDIRVTASHDRPDGTTAVCELAGDDGRHWFAKRHAGPQAYRREVTAYRDWVPALAGSAPDLVMADDTSLTLVVTAVPGTPADATPLTVRDERATHRRAGALLRVFHQAAPSAVTTDFAEVIRERYEKWRPRAERILRTAELRFVENAVHALADHPEAELTPCHRDYTARNWLIDGDRVYVIDFEHSRTDARIWDFLRLCHQVWPHRPDLRQEFMAGYGRDFTEAERAQLELCGVHHAMTTIVWAREVGDADFERVGRDVLTRLRAEAREPRN
ncbi:aminoglycoside phosphotransferase family protein [Streptantibioticus parmotrematis]|uniref:aminoglycoside phosphotransferase family protein n=1 Tax=Streptantibioticus parmotrematis TaxID=2873249 RepID=UPI0033F48799